MQILNVKGSFGVLNRAITGHQLKDEFPRVSSPRRKFIAFLKINDAQGITKRVRHKVFTSFCTVTSGVQNFNQSFAKFKDFIVSTDVGTDREIKVRVDVSGARTQEIFDEVFSKLVEAAQPIPGFRRVKGGKTPDIPKDVLLQIIGPSKVSKETILSIINTTVAEFVAKEGLNVTGDLRVEQSFDEIEAAFSPGKSFIFEAIILLTQTSRN